MARVRRNGVHHSIPFLDTGMGGKRRETKYLQKPVDDYRHAKYVECFTDSSPNSYTISMVSWYLVTPDGTLYSLWITLATYLQRDVQTRPQLSETLSEIAKLE